MSYLETSTIAQMLLHSLWQGAVVCGVVWVLLVTIGERRAEARYWVAMCGLMLVPLLSVGTYSWLGYGVSQETAQAWTVAVERLEEAREVGVSSAGTTTEVVGIGDASAQAPRRIPRYSNLDRRGPSWHTTVSCAWLAGVLTMLIRMTRNLRATARFQGGCAAVEDAGLLTALSALEERMGIRRRVRLLLHAGLPQPAAMGFLRPAIVLPLQALTGLDEDHLRAILAHELAHIRRHDYLLNIAQMLVEALLFFNPFVWLLSRTVRFEREICCDRLAAVALENTREYARALLRAVELFLAPEMVGVNSLGVEKSTRFVERLRRLVQPVGGVGGFRLRWKGLLGAGVVAMVVMGVVSCCADAHARRACGADSGD